MRKIIHTKRIYLGSMSMVLALAVLLSSLPYFNLSADALDTDNNSKTQTGYDSLISFQKHKWNDILEKTFNEYGTDDTAVLKPINPPGGGVPENWGYKYIPIPDASKLSVKADASNTYFGWANTGKEKWNGNYDNALPTSRMETIKYEGDEVENGDGTGKITANSKTITYKVYDVKNANELVAVMTTTKKNTDVKINLLADIDLGGDDENKYCWDSSKCLYPTSGRVFYFEGNGHTIYNMRTQAKTSSRAVTYNGPSFFGCFYGGSNEYNIVKNLNFSNCLSVSDSSSSNGINMKGTAIVASCIFSPNRVYMENVNVKDSFVYSNTAQTGTLFGRCQEILADLFIRNCSSQNCIVFGTDHSGGLTGCQHNTGKNYRVKYNAVFPKSPEAWLINNGIATFPEMVENCYSVDCTLFSLGTNGDSGGLLSCGGKLICRNCFTNNTVYGNTNTGAFFGRIVSESQINGLYDDEKNKSVHIYFENCYSSGSVEGLDKIGGFVGYEAQGVTKLISVHKNCYTTAMVGMDYAGNQLGGFIGYENTASGGTNVDSAVIKDESGKRLNVKANGTAAHGSVYINCYAAGEVGNIQTDTSVNPKEEDKTLGGFLGCTNGTNGTYINCYYDKQTTAMRERACGISNQYTSLKDKDGNAVGASQIPGVTGVYTQHSDSKGVQGLADTVNMGDGNAWTRTVTGKDDNGNDILVSATDRYPMLKCFVDNAKTNFGTFADENRTDADGNKLYTDDTITRINKQLAEKAQIAENYANASVSTALLNHWESIMDMSTGILPNENDWVPGAPQNKMSKDFAKAQETFKKLIGDTEVTTGEGGGKWRSFYKTYENVAVGTYDLKIQEGNSWSYNVGGDGFNGGNCQLKIEEPSNVIIVFEYQGNISEDLLDTNYKIKAYIAPVDENGKLLNPGADIEPTFLGGNARVSDQLENLVVAGSVNLTGSDWDTTQNLMTDNGNKKFTEKFTGITGGQNFAYTVVTKGQNKSTGKNRYFYLKSGDEGGKAYYDVLITYEWKDDGSGTERWVASETAYEAGTTTDVTAGCLEEAPRYNDSYNVETDGISFDKNEDKLVNFYTVAGDSNLTGNNWLGDMDENGGFTNKPQHEKAVKDGLMIQKTADGKVTYEKTYYNVPVGTTANPYSLSFKIVANGDWSYGIDYGHNSGSNYVIQLGTDDKNVSSCNVTIKFDPNADEKITIATTPRDLNVSHDEDQFSWYTVGTYLLVSNDGYNSKETVYDTVRDITSTFDLTSDKTTDNTMWDIDHDRNKENNLKETYGSDLDQSLSEIKIDYTVDGKTVNGTFGGDVIHINKVDDKQYSVNSFMPGKQWVKVTSGSDNKGIRRMRLIPTSYLDAGVDADIQVTYKQVEGTSSGYFENAVNVKNSEIKENGTGRTYSYAKGFDNTGSTPYSYYNFALSAVYSTTDTDGLGRYGNYSNGKTIAYNKEKIESLISGDMSSKNGTRGYFAMSSAFTKTSAYNDGYADGKPNGDNLQVDKLKEQTIIGASRHDNKKANSLSDNVAPTIVKVYKVGTDGSLTKILMDSSSNAIAKNKSNYEKWSGQKPFEENDVGTYKVIMYWSLSDGRYMQDSKNVNITVDTGNVEVKNKIIHNTSPVENPKDKFKFAIQFQPKLVDNNLKYLNGLYTATITTTDDSGATTESKTTIAISAGLATFELAHNQSIKIEGIPIRTQYTIKETDACDNEYSSECESFIRTDEQGSITDLASSIKPSTDTSDYYVGTMTAEIYSKATDTAEFLNTKPAPGIPQPHGTLLVTKTVIGSEDNSDGFEFTVIAKDSAGNPIDGKYGLMFFEDGKAIFKLKNGESKRATLPEGTEYTITETKAGKDGYDTRVNGEKSETGIYTNTIKSNETQTAAYENERHIKLNVHKVTAETGEPLAGVKFKLEYKNKNTQDTYQPVTCIKKSDGYHFSDADEAIYANAIETDSNGDIKFTDLPEAEYKLTEVETVEGYNLMPQSLEFSLPYTVDNNTNTSGVTVDVGDGSVSPENGKTYYEITYTITNSKIPSMPLTGINDDIMMIIIVSAMFAVWGAAFVIYNVRKKKLRKKNK